MLSGCSGRDLGFNPWVGRLPGEGNGFPVQYSHLEISAEKEVLRATQGAVCQKILSAGRAWKVLEGLCSPLVSIISHLDEKGQGQLPRLPAPFYTFVAPPSLPPPVFACLVLHILYNKLCPFLV